MRTPLKLHLRRGYTLVEMLVTLVVLSIVAAAITQLLIGQTRYFDRQVGLRGARAVSRTAINILTSDLRMVQDTLGISGLSTDGKTVTVRVPYRFGIVCSAPNDGTPVVAQMSPVDSAANAMSVAAGWGYRSTAATGQYVYPLNPTVAAASAANTLLCNTPVAGSGIRPVTVGSQTSAPMDLTPGNLALGGVVTVGTPVFLYQTITYQFRASAAFPGRIGLYRTVAGGRSEELMAPFEGSSRFRFYFMLDDTSRTTVTLADTTRIKGLDVYLVGLSTKKAWGKSTYTSSPSVTSVFFKNIRG